MDFTGFGWSVFWIFAVAAAIFAYLWTRTQKKHRSQAPRLYMEGLRALVDGDDHTAFDRLKQTANEDSNNIDAYLKLGDLLRRRGRLEKAIKVHEELTLRLGLSKSAQVAVHRSLAQDHVAAGNQQAAESSLIKILELDKDHKWAADQLVSLYEQSGRFEEAFETRRTALKRSGQADGHRLAIYKTLAGVQLAAAGKKHEARVQYKEALSFDEHCLPALLYIGDAYWEDGRADDALEWWTRFVNAAPAAAHVVSGRLERAYFELGQYGEINRFYEKILEHDHNNVTALLGLAELSFKKGEHDRALLQFRHVIDVSSDNLAARAGLIRILAQQEKWRQVSDEIDSLLGTASFADGGYVCSRCGHREPDPTWYCSKCKTVESFRL